MPTYDYICDACEHTWELFQSISENPKRKCPKCGKLKARRLIGAGTGLIFKGTGFYVTDYKKNRGKQEASQTKASTKDSSNSKASDSSTSSSESQSASKKATSDKSGSSSKSGS